MIDKQLYELEYCVIVYNNHYWGRGKTIDLAKKEFKKNGGDCRVKLHIILVLGDNNAFISELGNVCSVKNSRVIYL